MSVPRPTVDLERVRDELSAALLSDVLDAMGHRQQCLAAGIQPLQVDRPVVGFAFPVTIRRVYEVPDDSFRGLLAALDAIGADEVFVTPTARATDIAVWGELLSTACRARGAAGALTDGLIRDTPAIRELGFPVCSAGTIPYDSKGRHEIVEHGVACMIDRVRIAPGDLVVGDADGVAVTPAALVEKVVAAALEKRRSERAFRRSVAEGMPASVAFATYGVL